MNNNFTNLADVRNSFSEKTNKWIAVAGVCIALVFSCAMICGAVFYCCNSEKPILTKKTVVKELKNMQPEVDKQSAPDTTRDIAPCKVGCRPVVVSEECYDNIAVVLLCAGILAFVILSLWGAFTILLNVIKYENEFNAKILDVQKDLYKEMQMWELTKQKKLFEQVQEPKAEQVPDKEKKLGKDNNTQTEHNSSQSK